MSLRRAVGRLEDAVPFHSSSGMAALQEPLDLLDTDELHFTVWPFEPVKDNVHVLVDSYPGPAPAADGLGPCHDTDEPDA